MRFLVDAQLPRRLALWLRQQGYDVLHTLELPAANRTTDAEVMQRADDEDRIVISEDADFVNSHLMLGRPAKLLLVSTGNITNAALLELVSTHWALLSSALKNASFVELSATVVIVRG